MKLVATAGPIPSERNSIMKMRRTTLPRLAVANSLYVLVLATGLQAAPTVEQALQLKPVQSSVQFDRPSAKNRDQCTLEPTQGPNGWMLLDRNGHILRRFLDTNNDKKLDTWCYFKDGIEVYRDIDSDQNGRADQYRWLGTAGTRWGVDKNEDGKIERWQQISPEELSAEVIEAFKTRDVAHFRTLLISTAELGKLGLDGQRRKRVQDLASKAAIAFRHNIKDNPLIDPSAEWVSFGATRPGLVPASKGSVEKDLLVYESAVVMYKMGDGHRQMLIGTMIKVGDGWRIVQLPKDLAEGQQSTSSGLFFHATPHGSPNSNAATAQIAEAHQEFLDELEEIDKDLTAGGSVKQMFSLNARRAEVLEMIIDKTKDKTQRTNWIRQLADTLSAAAQTGDYADGVKHLQRLIKRLEISSEDSDQVPFAKFRYLSAAYSQRLQDPNADFAKVQEKWLADLEEYVNEYPNSQDTAEAMLQLGIAEEFSGEEDEAKRWYSRIAKSSGDSLLAKKAVGANRRLDSVGTVLNMQGRTLDGKPFQLSKYRGKIVALHYWATWCQPCLDDMKRLKKLQAHYGNKGFVPIGVNLDTGKTSASDFLKKNRHPWPQLYARGGLDSRLANELGILTLPTMLLLDRSGKVVNRGLHMGELEDELDKLLEQE